MSDKLCGCEIQHSYYCSNCFSYLQSQLAKKDEVIKIMKEALEFFMKFAECPYPERYVCRCEFCLDAKHRQALAKVDEIMKENK